MALALLTSSLEMLRSPTWLLLATLLLALPAEAATALDAARQQATSARARTQEVRTRQSGLRLELNRLAGKIEGLKAKGSLVGGGELQASLRRSQEVSGLLAEAARELSAAEQDAEREHLALLEAVSAELRALRQSFDRAKSRPERVAITTRMASLRRERDQVRAALPAAKVPALTDRGSEDPTELLEQADALRDAEDKVRGKVQALRGRIAELREERELDRRMDEFMGEEALFDDQDRRIRLRREERVTLKTEPQSPFTGAAETADQGMTVGTFSDPAPAERTSAPPPDSEPTPTARTTEISSVAEGVDHRPQLGGPGRNRSSARGGELGALERELAELETMASQLNRRAQGLEQRARELDQ
jgi:hypothetical protein